VIYVGSSMHVSASLASRSRQELPWSHEYITVHICRPASEYAVQLASHELHVQAVSAWLPQFGSVMAAESRLLNSNTRLGPDEVTSDGSSMVSRQRALAVAE
jgi:hypothetical protein